MPLRKPINDLSVHLNVKSFSEVYYYVGGGDVPLINSKPGAAQLHCAVIQGPDNRSSRCGGEEGEGVEEVEEEEATLKVVQMKSDSWGGKKKKKNERIKRRVSTGSMKKKRTKKMVKKSPDIFTFHQVGGRRS